jgi:hypothetical protein
VVLLERRCWFKGGGFAVLLQLRRWEAANLGLRQHRDMYLAACNMLVHRLTKPCWRWYFFGTCNSGGSTSLLASVLTMLEFDSGRWLR